MTVVTFPLIVLNGFRAGPPQGKSHSGGGEKRLAATDDMVLERFRKRETHKAMRK